MVAYIHNIELNNVCNIFDSILIIDGPLMRRDRTLYFLIQYCFNIEQKTHIEVNPKHIQNPTKRNKIITAHQLLKIS